MADTGETVLQAQTMVAQGRWDESRLTAARQALGEALKAYRVDVG